MTVCVRVCVCSASPKSSGVIPSVWACGDQVAVQMVKAQRDLGNLMESWQHGAPPVVQPKKVLVPPTYRGRGTAMKRPPTLRVQTST
jgi:hypothetical protein